MAPGVPALWRRCLEARRPVDNLGDDVIMDRDRYSPHAATKVSRLTLAVDADAPGRARAFVAAELGGHPRREDILLATSELVTNVVRHTHNAQAELILEHRLDAIRVRVRQLGPPFPRREPITSRQSHGRGLSIVEAVADRWGAGADGEVWFEAGA